MFGPGVNRLFLSASVSMHEKNMGIFFCGAKQDACFSSNSNQSLFLYLQTQMCYQWMVPNLYLAFVRVVHESLLVTYTIGQVGAHAFASADLSSVAT